MDFKAIVDSFTAMTCVVSVETLPDGKTGDFRIVAGNQAYIDSIEQPAPGTAMLSNKFVPNSLYTDYLTRDLNFEDYCYRAAVENKCLHSYVHPDRMQVWFNMMFIPLFSEEENLHYCIYIMEINFEAQVENMSDISSETASSVLNTCIRLRGTNDFNAAMKEVIKDVRDLCDAEHCCILVINELERSCYVLGEAFAEGSKLLPMENYVNDEFYDIAESWVGTIAGSNCLIAKDENDMQVVKERNPIWYESLTSAGAYNIVLFPLKSRGQLLGFMWALNFNKERATVIKETLEVTTFIVGSELGNYMLVERLRRLSSKDLLTGVMNRNEMNNFVDSLCHADEKNLKSVGVIFADINGLKAVNDIEGHNAGDLLLKNASKALREVVDEDRIFRAGGDEFSIILSDITQEELDCKIEEIRKACTKYENVFFALGGAVEEDGRNVRVALRRADEAMYEDKKLFYETHQAFGENKNDQRTGGIDADEKFRERSLFREMNFDHLTGLPSMTYFFKLAEVGRHNMHSAGIASAVLFMDFNGMKYYNKKYGFAEGDELIKAFAEIIKDVFGEKNCSRFGQDHFAVFTEEEFLEKRIKKVFREAKLINNGNSLPVKVGIYLDSMGLVETSLACDRATFARSAGKDENESYFRYFDGKMLSQEANRLYIVDNLDRAISEGWIRPFYQPIVRTTNRKVCDEEALARWIDPEKGMLSPADFIPILEETRLIYKVDLHILDVILERFKFQQRKGLEFVPVSVNLSRTDFESCDIVEEINNRVLASGFSKDLITIEITESVAGSNFEFIKDQVSKFQSYGFKVWMDDFGSGYSSLDLLQEMHFDLIKFDMRFMRQFETNPRSRIILRELMRMAQSLGIETVCEGVETEEQADFLNEIGCIKMQGYYFCKPIPAEDIWARYENGKQIGFENSGESEYHNAISAINMYDINSITNEEQDTVSKYFETMPISIIEYDGETINITRSNKSFRDFVRRYFKVHSVGGKEQIDTTTSKTGHKFAEAINECRDNGHRIFLNEKMRDGSEIHAMIKRIIDNPVRKVAAYAIAILDIIPEKKNKLTYADVAHALSSDYIYLYYVNVDTERFTEYTPDDGTAGISVERHGENFFAECIKDSEKFIYESDRASFKEVFNKENVLKTIDEQGAFVYSYRLIINGEANFVNLKAVRMAQDDNHIIIGVNNIDSQMRQQETIERLKEEQITYSRISALIGDFIGIYTVDPESGAYMQYSATKELSDLKTSKAGTDFFSDSIRDAKAVIVPEDTEYFESNFSREQVLEKTKNGGIYTIHYRLVIDGKPVKINLRAGMVNEKDGPQLIVGVSKESKTKQ